MILILLILQVLYHVWMIEILQSLTLTDQVSLNVFSELILRGEGFPDYEVESALLARVRYTLEIPQ